MLILGVGEYSVIHRFEYNFMKVSNGTASNYDKEIHKFQKNVREQCYDNRYVDKFNEPMEGYQIITDKGTILMLMSDKVNCCESWGIEFTRLVDPVSLIGSTIYNIKLSTSTLKDTSFNESGPYSGRRLPGDYTVEIYTDKGLVSLRGWCKHNGYYPHRLYVSWPGFTDSVYI